MMANSLRVKCIGASKSISNQIRIKIKCVNTIIIRLLANALVIDVWQDNFTYDFLIGYSEKYPECQVIVKGKGDFLNGNFNPGFNCKWGK